MTQLKQLSVPLPPLREQEAFAGVVARAVVEPSRDIVGLSVPRVSEGCGRMGESVRHPGREHAGAGVEGLFELLLAEAFDVSV